MKSVPVPNWLARPSARHAAPAQRGTPEATLPPPITSRLAGAASAWPKPSMVGQLAVVC
jgi:hypothetical protein